MTMLLLILDSLGTSELLVILVVALIFFGPRKLPQISRQIGKGLAEFKRASEDFKRTWEREVALEDSREAANSDRSMLPPDTPTGNSTVGRGQEVAAPSGEAIPGSTETVAGSVSLSTGDAIATQEKTSVSEPSRKRDWF